MYMKLPCLFCKKSENGSLVIVCMKAKKFPFPHVNEDSHSCIMHLRGSNFLFITMTCMFVDFQELERV
jgi:hypothetical protein